MIWNVGSIFCDLCFMFPEKDCSNKQKKGKKEKDVPKKWNVWSDCVSTK